LQQKNAVHVNLGLTSLETLLIAFHHRQWILLHDLGTGKS